MSQFTPENPHGSALMLKLTAARKGRIPRLSTGRRAGGSSAPAGRGKHHKPTAADRLFVERAVVAGSRIEDIAEALNIHDDTLRKHYRCEIMTARERLKVDAVRVLMDHLAGGSLDASKYVLSRVAGWAERRAVEVSGAGGAPAINLIISPTDADL